MLTRYEVRTYKTIVLSISLVKLLTENFKLKIKSIKNNFTYNLIKRLWRVESKEPDLCN